MVDRIGEQGAALEAVTNPDTTVSGLGAAGYLQAAIADAIANGTANASASRLGAQGRIYAIAGGGNISPNLHGGGWSPAALFAASEVGVWYDPSDLSTLWQDEAGTIPVTTDGQTVARIDDKSGNGFHATQATTTKRPTYKTDGVLHWLAFDGSSDALVTSSIDLSITDNVSIFVGVAAISNASLAMLCEFSATIVSNAGSFYVASLDTAPKSWSSMARGSAAASQSANAYTELGSPPDLAVLSITHDISSDLSTMRRNGVSATSGTGDKGTGNFGNYPLYIGARNQTSYYFNGKFYGFCLTSRTATAAEINAAETYFARKIGVVNPNISTVSINDSYTPNQVWTHYETSSFARYVFDTDATAITVNTFNNIYAQYAGFAEIGVYVDGVYNQKIDILNDFYASNEITLSAGTKRVEFVNSGQSKPKNSVSGTYVISVSGNSALVPVAETPTNRVLIYGDSIAVGGNSTDPVKDAWAQLLRASYYPDSVANESYGVRSLYVDAATSQLRSAFVAKIATYNPSIIWIAIGTNDYGLNLWTAANFGAAYSALLDDLHTELPDATIYCQTPILRTTETANGLGSTLGDYRTEIGTAVSTRTAYATFVDGKAFMTTASLADGVHPTTAGHILYADAVKTVLGIS